MREIVRLSGADINSWTEGSGSHRGRRPARIFVIKVRECWVWLTSHTGVLAVADARSCWATGGGAERNIADAGVKGPLLSQAALAHAFTALIADRLVGVALLLLLVVSRLSIVTG